MCLGGAYFERLGVLPDYNNDARTLRIFDVGNIFEEWLLDVAEPSLEKDTRMERQEDLVDEELDLTGHPDATIYKGKDLLDTWEIKTMHSRGFWHMDNEGQKGKPHHRLQLWSYLKMSGGAKGRLMYVSKDDLATRQYEVLADDKDLESEFSRAIGELNGAWKTKKPPAIIRDHTDWRTGYCRWHSHCLESVGLTDIYVSESQKEIYRAMETHKGYHNESVPGRKTPLRFKIVNIKDYRDQLRSVEKN